MDAYEELEKFLDDYFGPTPEEDKKDSSKKSDDDSDDEDSWPKEDGTGSGSSSDDEQDEKSVKDEAEADSDLDGGEAYRCRCKIVNCFDNFSCTELQNQRDAVKKMTKDEKETAIMGALQPCAYDKETRRGTRKRVRYSYVFKGFKICKGTFAYIYNIGPRSLKSLIRHMHTKGVVPRVHGNKGRKAQVQKFTELKDQCVEFIIKQSKEHAVAMPLNPDDKDKEREVYFPSSYTRKALHKVYLDVCTESGARALGLSSFKATWTLRCPHIKISNPKDDVGPKFEPSRDKARGPEGVTNDYDKSAVTDALKARLQDVHASQPVFPGNMSTASSGPKEFEHGAGLTGPVQPWPNNYGHVPYPYDYSKIVPPHRTYSQTASVDTRDGDHGFCSLPQWSNNFGHAPYPYDSSRMVPEARLGVPMTSRLPGYDAQQDCHQVHYNYGVDEGQLINRYHDSAIQQNPNEENQPVICPLRHPKTGRKALFMFTHDDHKIYELSQYKEEYRSWFLGNTVQHDGSLYMTTPVDPVFLVLPYLIQEESKSGKFVTLDQLLYDEEFLDTRKLASVTAVSELYQVAQVRGDEDLKVYRYDRDRTLSWLKLKAERMADVLEKKNICVSGAHSATFIRSKKSSASKEEYMRYGFGVVSDYLSVDLATVLREYLGIPVIAEKRATDSENPPSKRPKLGDLTPTEDYSKQNGAQGKMDLVKLTNAQKKLSKVDKTGMKSMSSFFSPKPKTDVPATSQNL